MSIKTKLFLTILTITSSVIIASFLFARWSFERGFVDYITTVEQHRLDKLSSTFIAAYRDGDNSWDPIIDVGISAFINGHTVQRRPPPPQQFRAHQQKKRPPHPRPNGPPIALYNLQGNMILGPKDAISLSSRYQRVEFPLILNGETIGQLASWPASPRSSPLADEFAEQQLLASAGITLLSLILAGVVSWFLAEKLVKPIKALLEGVQQLSAGNYSVQFKHKQQDELGLLMEEVESLSLVLDKTRTAKSRLFADISHELRTPLTVLAGEIEALKAGIRAFDQVQLSSLEQETQLLTHLVDDLYQLSLSDMGGLRYEFKHQNLSELVNQTINSKHALIHKHGLSLDLAIAESIFADIDKTRFEQLLNNVLTNAITYTDSPGSIRIYLEKTEEIILTVEDSAPGVPQKDINKIFNALYRQEASRTRKTMGAGLGLSISKNIVAAHQGVIHAESSALGGLKIIIKLSQKTEFTHD